MTYLSSQMEFQNEELSRRSVSAVSKDLMNYKSKSNQIKLGFFKLYNTTATWKMDTLQEGRVQSRVQSSGAETLHSVYLHSDDSINVNLREKSKEEMEYFGRPTERHFLSELCSCE